jgi:iron-sulfur cluster repair protein YtfE (RIC family)
MLGKIGMPVAPADAVDLLLECHGRIRGFLAMARRLGEARDEAPQALSDAAVRVHRYFSLALPLHARDEEESILPRLRGRDPAVDLQLEVMVREHQEHQHALGRLVEACAAIAADPGRHPALAGSLLQATTELDRHFIHHLAREEEVIFPAVRRLLDAATDSSIVKEIRLRRDLRGGRVPEV